jgi:hypothetical protein
MAVVTIKVLSHGTRVRIRGERGRYVVFHSEWKDGREIDHLARTDNGPGHFRTVTRDRLVVLRK